MKLTNKEIKVLAAFIEEGADTVRAEEPEHIIEDNMTIMNALDLAEATGFSSHQIAGIMSSLHEKGLIEDSGESPRGLKQTDWSATDKGVINGWPHYAA